MITDDDMVAAIASVNAERTRSFEILGIEKLGDGRMLLRFTIRGEESTYRVKLPLPSSADLKPWLTHSPRDAFDAAGELIVFLMEEVETDRAHWAQIVTVDGEQEFFLEPYGFRAADPREHMRLLRASGPDGWWGHIDVNEVPIGHQSGAWRRIRDRLRRWRGRN